MTRNETLTQKVSREVTGLNGAIFVHLDHAEGRILGVRISTKWKDGESFDKIATAIGDALTDMVGAVQDDHDVAAASVADIQSSETSGPPAKRQQPLKQSRY